MDDRNPYRTLPRRAFWRTAVAERGAGAVEDLWRPKFAVGREDAVSTAGSCFAQHISRALAKAGFNWLDAEPAPAVAGPELRKAYNYGVFSFRTGNVYTAAALRQWLGWAIGGAATPDEIWEQDDRFYDPFRPAIEPRGFASPEELLASRRTTMRAVRAAVEASSVFVFTLGLTEAWENAAGHVYPMCPGTVAGAFDPAVHIFRNYDYPRVRADMAAAVALMRSVNPGLRILLTVSPVPLTATASDAHVLAATTYSKSTLRAVAGDLAASDPAIDYFPSYEIVTGSPFAGRFFEPNLRNVSADGVGFVMKTFLAPLGAGDAPSIKPKKPANIVEAEDDELVCEEEILSESAPDATQAASVGRGVLARVFGARRS